ncbi:MAG: response regulator [Deltaproteobacteria bacterium]|nr:response regulator [Deltaproteobacteria bacterium]MBI3387349.1 response regulator [Deltaproteobacteria bacterium]
MSKPTPNAKKTVLIVDDEENIRLIVSRLMQTAGHRTLTAETGQQAIDLLRAGTRLDLVILDVRMPELDGFQTLVQIRNDLALTELPVIMLTGQKSDEDLLAGYGVGADYYLTKPPKLDRLLNIVAYLIGDLTAEQRAKLEQSL